MMHPRRRRRTAGDPHPARRPLLAVVAFAILLALGAGIAFVLTDALGIRSEASDVPAETPSVAPATATLAPPRVLHPAATGSTRVATALAELDDAVGSAATTSGTATLSVDVTGAAAPGVAADDDTYTLSGTASALRVSAATEAGAARGVYDLASAVRDGTSVSARLGQTVTSRLPFRMADLGAVGVVPDEEEWSKGDDYSHNSKAFENAILPHAPYVDTVALAAARTEFDTYVRHLLAEGYTAIAIPGLLEYLTFSDVGDGRQVYHEGDEHVARALAMRQEFGAMWESAHDAGLKVYFRTDMLTLTPPLRAYLTEHFGGLDTENPDLWSVYAKGLDELYRTMPYVDGVLIRIGEAGSVYDLPGWDYTSELAVTTVASVRTMLTTLLAQAEHVDREVIFRSWSVGVGAVGDMHTNPASYHAVLDGIDSPHLIVSTKYTLGDFYSHLPLNTTLETGDQRRIIEYQSRREFENFGSFPNDLGPLYATAFQELLAANPHIEGIWTWTQDGGPWRAGPLSLELKTGFWQLAELDTVLAVRLARDPSTDPAEVTAGWARRWFSDDPATLHAITEAMASSREAITQGLYIGPYADKRVFAIGLEPPPMMWIFEWDIVTGDSAALDVIYAISRDHLDEAIDGGAVANAAVARMQALVGATDPSTWKDPSLRSMFTKTLAYEASTLRMLGDYRAMVLRKAEWNDTGDPTAYAEWQTARTAFLTSSSAHESQYGGDPYYPAYNLTAAHLGLDRADRDLPMAWASGILLALVVLWLAYGAVAGGVGPVQGRFASRVSRWPGARAARALVIAGTRPWRAAEAVAGLGVADRVLLLATPAVALVLSRAILTWFAAPAHLVVTLGAWAVFVAALVAATRLLGGRALPVLAAVGGAGLLRVVLLSAVLLPTGPGGYWFGFWTDPVSRSLYTIAAFALFAWVIVGAAWSLVPSWGRRRAVGIVMAASGAAVALLATLVGAIGLEQALTLWNDQLALLPWGLSRILGISVYLGIPAETPWWVAAVGAVAFVAGLAFAVPKANRRVRGQSA
ncbi:hypothetical protein, partial [Leifsonia poae]